MWLTAKCLLLTSWYLLLLLGLLSFCCHDWLLSSLINQFVLFANRTVTQTYCFQDFVQTQRFYDWQSCVPVIDASLMSLFWFCSPSEKWPATCWWHSTSSTTCRWRTWGSFEASRCTRAAILWPSSSTIDGMATTAWGSWACATSQVWTLARVLQLRAMTF